MNIHKLFQIQQKLDQKILETHKLHYKNLVPAKILALQVELGELANETRCFKFWSLKEPSAKEMILEEYVDSIHFILSIGLDKGYDQTLGIQTEGIEVKGQDDDTTQMAGFARIFDSISRFSQDESEANYTNVFEELVRLGRILGFSTTEIEEAYLDKNKVNHARQEEGY